MEDDYLMKVLRQLSSKRLWMFMAITAGFLCAITAYVGESIAIYMGITAVVATFMSYKTDY